MGLMGILEAAPIADSITFVFSIFVLHSEYKKLSKLNNSNDIQDVGIKKKGYKGKKIVITISREYGSGGRYVGKLLSELLNINLYDKELITLASKSSGLSKNYIKESEQKLVSAKFSNNNDDRIFVAEEKIIKKLAKMESCIIVGRCADYILKDSKDVVSVFLYSDDVNKLKRVVKYYGIKEEKAKVTIDRINRDRAKHYKYYTNRNWTDLDNYDLALNVDVLGPEKTAGIIKEFVEEK